MSNESRQQQLHATVDRLSGVRVGVVHDLVADVDVNGLSDRVSREAPVLMVVMKEGAATACPAELRERIGGF